MYIYVYICTYGSQASVVVVGGSPLASYLVGILGNFKVPTPKDGRPPDTQRSTSSSSSSSSCDAEVDTPTLGGTNLKVGEESLGEAFCEVCQIQGHHYTSECPLLAPMSDGEFCIRLKALQAKGFLDTPAPEGIVRARFARIHMSRVKRMFMPGNGDCLFICLTMGLAMTQERPEVHKPLTYETRVLMGAGCRKWFLRVARQKFNENAIIHDDLTWQATLVDNLWDTPEAYIHAMSPPITEKFQWGGFVYIYIIYIYI